jgi:Glycosyl hydrolases family 28
VYALRDRRSYTFKVFRGGIAVLLAALCLSSAGGGSAAGLSPSLVVHPPMPSLDQSRTFEVRVRQPGGAWKTVETYTAIVDLDTRSLVSFAMFDSDGPVEVEVTKGSGTMGSAVVRPRSLGIKADIADGRRTATFVMARPSNVSFEVNGDRLHNLHLFSNPLERHVPKAGAGVMFFGPGVHRIPGDHQLKIPSHTTVYLAPGAVIEGALWIDHATDVVVRGHGILDPAAVYSENQEESVQITYSRNVAIRDLTIINSPDMGFDIYDSDYVTLANVRELNVARWTDGIDVLASSNVLIDGAFLRTSDDSVAVYASAWGAEGDTKHVVVRNSTLWADVAHPLMVGMHGNPNDRDVVEDLTFRNLDVLEHDEDLPRYQGAMAVNAGDRVTVRDVRFDDIRIENFAQGQVVNLRVFLNPSYNKEPGNAVDRVLFRNIAYAGEGDLPSQIAGYDEDRRVTNVTFENVTRNGKSVMTADAGNMEVGPHTGRITFRTQPATKTWNDTSRSIRYAGSWRRAARVQAYRNDWHSTRSAGSRATFTFSGREARAFGVTSPATGRLQVRVDGKLWTTVDTYSPLRRTEQVWFDTGVLSRGRHTIELRCTGTKNLLSTGRSIVFDKVQVVN